MSEWNEIFEIRMKRMKLEFLICKYFEIFKKFNFSWSQMGIWNFQKGIQLFKPI